MACLGRIELRFELLVDVNVAGVRGEKSVRRVNCLSIVCGRFHAASAVREYGLCVCVVHREPWSLV